MAVLELDERYQSLVQELLAEVAAYNPDVDRELLSRAFRFAAAAHVYNIAPKDGTVIGALQTAAVLEPLAPARSKKRDTKISPSETHTGISLPSSVSAHGD